MSSAFSLLIHTFPRQAKSSRQFGFVCVEVLWSINPLESCQGQSVYLSKLSPGRLSPLGSLLLFFFVCFFCFEVLWPSQPIIVMSRAVSLLNHTFPGQA